MSERREIEREFASSLDAPPNDVWRWATSLEGINHELMPYASMKSIAGIERLQDIVPQGGQHVIDVSLRLFGLLPMKRVGIHMVELGDAGFVEESNQPGMRSWRHERRLKPEGDGTRVIDRLRFCPALLIGQTTKIVETLFEHRHARLARHWNGERNR